MRASEKRVVILFHPRPAGGKTSRLSIPYALLYLERGLRDLGLEIVLVDEQTQPDYLPILASYRERLLLVGVTAMTGQQIQGGITFSKKVREFCAAAVVWGGWHPTLLPEQTLGEPFIDFVVVGQGERPLRQLVERLRDEEDVTDIPGLGFKNSGAISVNPAAPLQNLSAFPPINLRLLDLGKYVYRNAFAERCLGYFASHGCPFDCTFCCIGKVYRHHWLHKPIGQIIGDLRCLKEHAGIDSVSFDDDNFFVSAEFVRELAQSMIDAKLDLKWETSAQAGLMARVFTDADMQLMVAAGCRQIYIGAESGDQHVLELLHKRTKVEDNLNFVKLVSRHGIIPQMSTMVCLPAESQEDLRLTIDMIRQAKLVNRRLRASVYLYTPYPGTLLFERAREKGFVPPEHLEQWANHTLRKFRAPWAPKGIRWKLECFANFYFPLLDPNFYRKVKEPVIRAVVFLINRFFFPIVWLRFKMNCFRAPVEAICFLHLLHLFNKFTRKNYTLGPESYVW